MAAMRPRIAGLAAAFFLSVSAATAQNLLGNSGFSGDFGGWRVRTGVSGSAVFSAEDAGGIAGSGSAFLTTTLPDASEFVPLLSQCVPVVAGKTYRLSQTVRFQTGETVRGAAQIVVTYAASSDCQASLAGVGLVTERSRNGVWFIDTQDFTMPAGTLAAKIDVGMDKDDAGGSMTAWVDDVTFAPLGAPAETLVGYLAVAGSTGGLAGSFFKTSVQLVNPGAASISGHFVYHPAGVSGSPGDPTLGWSLAPGQSFSWDDVVAALGKSGLGSLDVFAAGGEAPVIVARIYNDAGPEGTSGFTESVVAPEDVAGGAGTSVTGFLLCPADVGRFRYNVGLRTLDAPVSVSVTVLDAAGNVAHTITRDYPASFFAQTTVAAFLGGFAIDNGYSLRITFTGGGLIVYGATVDNVTNDPSVQPMPYLFAVA